MERFCEGETKKDTPFGQKAMLSIARVQGPWDKKTSDLLKDQVLREMDFDKGLDIGDEEMGTVEKALTRVLAGGIFTFIGDGSAAHLLLGRTVSLTEEDRGLIILDNLTQMPGRTLGEDSNWKMAMLISSELERGETIEKIITRVRNKFGGLFGKLNKVIGAYKKLHPDEHGDVGDFEQEAKEIVAQINEVYGGSDEQFRLNKQLFQENTLKEISRRISEFPEARLNKTVEDLKSLTGDEVTDGGIGAARKMFITIIQSRSKKFDEAIKALQ